MTTYTNEEWKKLFKKHKITARKYNGDDAFSWAIFLNGKDKPKISGLTISEIPYYKRRVYEIYVKGKENNG